MLLLLELQHGGNLLREDHRLPGDCSLPGLLRGLRCDDLLHQLLLLRGELRRGKVEMFKGTGAYRIKLDPNEVRPLTRLRHKARYIRRDRGIHD